MTDSAVTIVLLGAPVPWARAQGGRSTRLFTPTKQRNNAATLRLAAQQAVTHGPFIVPVSLDVLAEFEIPKTWSNRKRHAAIAGEIRPGKRPDLSNIIKQVEDSLNGVVFTDDSLVVEIHARKVYGPQPKVVITVASQR